MKQTKLSLLGIIIFILFSGSACGVKGKPLPPLDPPKIGAGIEAATLEEEKDESN